MQLRFVKYEGAGNDFILIDNREATFEASASLIAQLCDRHFGIGADGLMTLSRSLEPDVDCQMHYYNADGSEGEMCGNGARCFTLFALHLGLVSRRCCFRATDAKHEAQILRSDASEGIIRIQMIDVDEIQRGENWCFLNTGVPHYVEFVDDITKIDLRRRGAEIRYDKQRFPQGTNVNFAHIVGEGMVEMRTYERGVEDETLACGTGATAVALASNFLYQPSTHDFELRLKGGKLLVRFEHEPQTLKYRDILLEGPARRVFEGEIEIK